MGKKLLAYDLGTSGLKASLYEADGTQILDAYSAYPTLYPPMGWHEQRPSDWWKAVVKTTHELVELSRIDVKSIECLAISGHSFGVVPIDNDGDLLMESTPIWSDMRGKELGDEFLKGISFNDWYLRTGSSMVGPYSVFKIMWLKKYMPSLYGKTHKILGTKDFVNYKLTGKVCTDHSYASGSGVYDLMTHAYAPGLVRIASLDENLLPDIVPSTHVLGTISKQASQETGLPTTVKVVCGGVDNSCMALGARGIRDGNVYTNLGSSAWIAITCEKPILNLAFYPNTFAHVIPGLFNSAVTIFSAGNSLKWVRDVFCEDLKQQAERASRNAYDIITRMAFTSPIGANGLIFNPTLAMGSPLDQSVNTKGAFTGLDLKHERNDLLRATLEGITLNLAMALDELKKMVSLSREMLLVGGGSNSPLWRQIFADAYDMEIVKTNVGQNAGALGAAAVAAVGAGLWPGFERVEKLHRIENMSVPIPENVKKYKDIMKVYKFVAKCQAAIGDRLTALNY